MVISKDKKKELRLIRSFMVDIVAEFHKEPGCQSVAKRFEMQLKGYDKALTVLNIKVGEEV